MSENRNSKTLFRPLLLVVAVVVVLSVGCARTNSIVARSGPDAEPSLANARSNLIASDSIGAAILDQSDTRVAQADEEALQVDGLRQFASQVRLAERPRQVIVRGEQLQSQPQPTGYATVEEQSD